MISVIKIEGKSLRYGLAALPLLYSLYLLYQHCNGGVPAHHFLANESYPEISNWYGIPIIAIFSYLIYKLFSKTTLSTLHLYEFLIAFAYGISIYLCFKNLIELDPKYLFLGLFIIGFIYPIYRVNIYFGIVLGMTYGFGTVLPTAMIGIAVSISFTWHFFKQKFF